MFVTDEDAYNDMAEGSPVRGAESVYQSSTIGATFSVELGQVDEQLDTEDVSLCIFPKIFKNDIL